MKSIVVTFLLLSITALLLYLEENPSFTNPKTADVLVTEGIDTIYYLCDVPPGEFEYYLKKEPREIIIPSKQGHIILLNHDNRYKVDVSYKQPISGTEIPIKGHVFH